MIPYRSATVPAPAGLPDCWPHTASRNVAALLLMLLLWSVVLAPNVSVQAADASPVAAADHCNAAVPTAAYFNASSGVCVCRMPWGGARCQTLLLDLHHPHRHARNAAAAAATMPQAAACAASTAGVPCTAVAEDGSGGSGRPAFDPSSDLSPRGGWFCLREASTRRYLSFGGRVNMSAPQWPLGTSEACEPLLLFWTRSEDSVACVIGFDDATSPTRRPVGMFGTSIKGDIFAQLPRRCYENDVAVNFASFRQGAPHDTGTPQAFSSGKFFGFDAASKTFVAKSKNDAPQALVTASPAPAAAVTVAALANGTEYCLYRGELFSGEDGGVPNRRYLSPGNAIALGAGTAYPTVPLVVGANDDAACFTGANRFRLVKAAASAAVSSGGAACTDPARYVCLQPSASPNPAAYAAEARFGHGRFLAPERPEHGSAMLAAAATECAGTAVWLFAADGSLRLALNQSLALHVRDGIVFRQPSEPSAYLSSVDDRTTIAGITFEEPPATTAASGGAAEGPHPRRCAGDAIGATPPSRDAIRKSVRDATPAAGREFGADSGSLPRLSDLLSSPDASVNAASSVGDGTVASPHRNVLLICLRYNGPVRGGTVGPGGSAAPALFIATRQRYGFQRECTRDALVEVMPLQQAGSPPTDAAGVEHVCLRVALGSRTHAYLKWSAGGTAESVAQVTDQQQTRCTAGETARELVWAWGTAEQAASAAPFDGKQVPSPLQLQVTPPQGTPTLQSEVRLYWSINASTVSTESHVRFLVATPTPPGWPGEAATTQACLSGIGANAGMLYVNPAGAVSIAAGFMCSRGAATADFTLVPESHPATCQSDDESPYFCLYSAANARFLGFTKHVNGDWRPTLTGACGHEAGSLFFYGAADALGVSMNHTLSNRAMGLHSSSPRLWQEAPDGDVWEQTTRLRLERPGTDHCELGPHPDAPLRTPGALVSPGDTAGRIVCLYEAGTRQFVAWRRRPPSTTSSTAVAGLHVVAVPGTPSDCGTAPTLTTTAGGVGEETGLAWSTDKTDAIVFGIRPHGPGRDPSTTALGSRYLRFDRPETTGSTQYNLSVSAERVGVAEFSAAAATVGGGYIVERTTASVTKGAKIAVVPRPGMPGEFDVVGSKVGGLANNVITISAGAVTAEGPVVAAAAADKSNNATAAGVVVCLRSLKDGLHRNRRYMQPRVRVTVLADNLNCDAHSLFRVERAVGGCGGPERTVVCLRSMADPTRLVFQDQRHSYVQLTEAPTAVCDAGTLGVTFILRGSMLQLRSLSAASWGSTVLATDDTYIEQPANQAYTKKGLASISLVAERISGVHAGGDGDATAVAAAKEEETEAAALASVGLVDDLPPVRMTPTPTSAVPACHRAGVAPSSPNNSSAPPTWVAIAGHSEAVAKLKEFGPARAPSLRTPLVAHVIKSAIDAAIQGTIAQVAQTFLAATAPAAAAPPPSLSSAGDLVSLANFTSSGIGGRWLTAMRVPTPASSVCRAATNTPGNGPTQMAVNRPMVVHYGCPRIMCTGKGVVYPVGTALDCRKEFLQATFPAETNRCGSDGAGRVKQKMLCYAYETPYAAANVTCVGPPPPTPTPAPHADAADACLEAPEAQTMLGTIEGLGEAPFDIPSVRLDLLPPLSAPQLAALPPSGRALVRMRVRYLVQRGPGSDPSDGVVLEAPVAPRWLGQGGELPADIGAELASVATPSGDLTALVGALFATSRDASTGITSSVALGVVGGATAIQMMMLANRGGEGGGAAAPVALSPEEAVAVLLANATAGHLAERDARARSGLTHWMDATCASAQERHDDWRQDATAAVGWGASTPAAAAALVNASLAVPFLSAWLLSCNLALSSLFAESSSPSLRTSDTCATSAALDDAVDAEPRSGGPRRPYRLCAADARASGISAKAKIMIESMIEPGLLAALHLGSLTPFQAGALPMAFSFVWVTAPDGWQTNATVPPAESPRSPPPAATATRTRDATSATATEHRRTTVPAAEDAPTVTATAEEQEQDVEGTAPLARSMSESVAGASRTRRLAGSVSETAAVPANDTAALSSAASTKRPAERVVARPVVVGATAAVMVAVVASSASGALAIGAAGRVPAVQAVGKAALCALRADADAVEEGVDVDITELPLQMPVAVVAASPDDGGSDLSTDTAASLNVATGAALWATLLAVLPAAALAARYRLVTPPPEVPPRPATALHLSSVAAAVFGSFFAPGVVQVSASIALNPVLRAASGAPLLVPLHALFVALMLVVPAAMALVAARAPQLAPAPKVPWRGAFEIRRDAPGVAAGIPAASPSVAAADGDAQSPAKAASGHLTDHTKRVLFVHCFGVVFDACSDFSRAATRLYLAIDVACATALALISALPQAACSLVGPACLAVAVAYAAYVGYVRPFLSRIELAGMAANAVLQVVGACSVTAVTTLQGGHGGLEVLGFVQLGQLAVLLVLPVAVLIASVRSSSNSCSETSVDTYPVQTVVATPLLADVPVLESSTANGHGNGHGSDQGAPPDASGFGGHGDGGPRRNPLLARGPAASP